MANPVLGVVDCPLPWCRQPGAEIRQGEKGTPYIVCDCCVSMVKSQSRQGRDGMRALMPAPAVEKPAPTAAPSKEEGEGKEKAPPAAAKPADMWAILGVKHAG